MPRTSHRRRPGTRPAMQSDQGPRPASSIKQSGWLLCALKGRDFNFLVGICSVGPSHLLGVLARSPCLRPPPPRFARAEAAPCVQPVDDVVHDAPAARWLRSETPRFPATVFRVAHSHPGTALSTGTSTGPLPPPVCPQQKSSRAEAVSGGRPTICTVCARSGGSRLLERVLADVPGDRLVQSRATKSRSRARRR